MAAPLTDVADRALGRMVVGGIPAAAARRFRDREAIYCVGTAFCRERLAGFKIPRTILFEDQPLPRTPTGEVQKFLLVERFAGQA